MSNHYFKAVSVIAMALGTGVTACASAGAPASGAVAAPTMLTAAELTSSPASSEIPTSRQASSRGETPGDAAAGKLVCRTHNCVDGTTELYLDWDGKVGSGTLRTTAPSGMIYEKKVRAERYQGTIVVDEPSSTDLADHAAMVVQQNGKLHMRIGAPGQAVSACE